MLLPLQDLVEKPFEVVYAETVTVTVTLDGVQITDAILKVALLSVTGLHNGADAAVDHCKLQ